MPLFDPVLFLSFDSAGATAANGTACAIATAETGVLTVVSKFEVLNCNLWSCHQPDPENAPQCRISAGIHPILDAI